MNGFVLKYFLLILKIYSEEVKLNQKPYLWKI